MHNPHDPLPISIVHAVESPGSRAPDITIELVRPDDLLHLSIAGYNLQIDPQGDPAQPRLVRIDPHAEAYLSVIFPPQSIAETAYFEEQPDLNGGLTQIPDPPPIPARMAGPSRLVFRLPAAVTALPYTLEGLLDWSQLVPNVVPVAAVPPGMSPTHDQLPQIVQPGTLQTALELPYRLFLSPGTDAVWLHDGAPVTHAGRTELWHTRLAHRLPATAGGNENNPSRVEEISAANPGFLRAIWSPDFAPGNPPGQSAPALGVTALSPNDRHQLVALTSSFTDYSLHAFLTRFDLEGGIQRFPHKSLYVPAPVHAERVLLSSLGGWLRSRSNWVIDVDNLPTYVNEPDPTHPKDRLAISEWVHDAMQGRDHYVRIVKEGHLYPFGHRAALVKVTERRFEAIPSGPLANTPAAYLRQHMYIVVREPERSYLNAPFDHAGREMPITSLRLTTLVTPDIDYPYPPPPQSNIMTTAPIPGTTGSCWVQVDGDPFRFHVVAQDLVGQWIEFTTALIFISGDEQNPQQVPPAYLASDPARRVCPVPGQKAAFAPPSGPGTDDTSFATTALYFDTQDAPTVSGKFLPRLFKADVHIPAVEHLLGVNAPTTIRLFENYLVDDIDSNAGVFAQIVTEQNGQFTQAMLPVVFPADKAGGIATPNLNLSSVTRMLGPVAGDPLNAAKDHFDARDFFGGWTNNLPKLFGSLSLADVLPNPKVDPLGTARASMNAPRLQIQALDDPQHPNRIVITLDWTPQVHAFDGGFLKFDTTNQTSLAIHARIEKPVNLAPQAGPPAFNQAGSFTLSGSLTSFSLEFLQIIKVNFTSFSFTSVSGKKMDVQVHLDDKTPVEFEGDLDFVRQLSQIIPPGAFGDGPSLDVTSTQVYVGYAIALPPLSVGVFSLEHVGISAGLTLPFLDGKPLLDFAFAERHHPFLLTVALLGGSGFLHVQLDTGVVKLVEAAFEFGGSFDLDIGVASGGVHIMAGIYFAMQDGKGVILSGYLRMGGEVSVLGLISVSIEFNLSFTYDSKKNKATGRATLTVAVSVAFFSTSVDLTVERSFGRDGGDPTFGQLMDADAWSEYAAAFA